MIRDISILGLEKEKCTGCGACSNKCPVGAIQMQYNEEGFLYPAIDEERCIKCGLCKAVCPSMTTYSDNNVLGKIYAACANDSIRMESSSGGIFTILAAAVLKEGGVVCGASFTSDFYEVEHIVIDKEKELTKLRGSKYVQSATKDTFKMIGEYLNKNRKVLFSGTPCQVAGLKKYLGKEYENLLTVDILCHGVPSPLAYKKFLNTVLKQANAENSKIEEVSFRKKSEWGWAPSLYIRLSNGYTYSKSKTQTSWYSSFLNILNTRECCGKCQFNKIPRVGDITLGDFWGIIDWDKSKDDGKGISVVTINNRKGQAFFNTVRDELKMLEEIPFTAAISRNGNMTGSSVNHRNRKRFFKLLNQNENYEKIVDYSLKRKFDIGYVGWWYGQNYGSVLTNFALNRYLEAENYSVLMIEWPEHIKPTWPIQDSFARRFAKKYYEMSMRRTYDELPDLNYYCDSFIVGSDQLWNYWSTKDNGSFFFLDFADDSKKKIAYATSFGHPTYGAPKNILQETSFHMSRFDAISVREEDGVKICKDTFGVDAIRTIDPVFFLKKEEYERLLRDAKVHEESKYIFAYILTPTVEKREMLKKIAERMNLKLVLVLDAQADHEKNRNIMNMPESLKENLELEDWIYYLANSELVITDSYHGLCFSLIFRKKFVCIANILRGLSRFQTLLQMTDLEKNMFFDTEKAVDSKVYLKEINYDKVWEKLDIEIEKSKEWLLHALREPKVCKSTAYDLLVKRIAVLEKKLRELEKK